MRRIHLAVLWHMHQPQYRDPETGAYVLPWTRLHATKDYWGMVKLLEEFPKFHATFNVVPSLCMQLEEYASGNFNEPWFGLAFHAAEKLTKEGKREILDRAFQVNQERLMSRWPRFVELYEWSRAAGGAQALVTFTPRDWRDLQVLSQLAWMDEEWLAKDPVVSRLANRGKRFQRKRQIGFEGEADRADGLGVARVPGSGGAGTDRDQHDAVLSPDFAAAVRFGYCAGGESGDAAAADERFEGRRMRGNSCGGRRNITRECLERSRWGCGRRKDRCPTSR